MACRIGITANLDDRKRYWKAQHPSMTDWQIVHECRTKTEAQEVETRLAEQYGCEAHHGGDGPEYATWYVYAFNY